MRDELLENNIVSLHGRGWTMRRLSREFGISRGRVKRILQRNTQRREQGDSHLVAPRKRASKLDAYKSYITQLIEQYKDPPITHQRVFELLQEKGYAGKITILRDYLAGLRGKKVKDPIVTVETSPGQRASHDWSDYYIDFTNGVSEKVTFLSFILNYCRRQYIEVVDDKTQTTLMSGLINAFIYFDGVPREIKSDNQKACVDRWELGKPLFNKHYLSFATHYCFRPLAIRPGKPRENLKVERPFYYLETNFLNGRSFRDKQDLKAQLQSWLTGKNDQRIHRSTGQKPIELYGEEVAFLQPLPAKQYDTSIIEYRIVNHESAIQWDNYYYMVPAEYMYESCPVRVNGGQIIIYSPDCRQIATHQLAEKGRKDRYIGRVKQAGKYSLSGHQIAERLHAFGPIMGEYIQKIKKHKPSTYMHHLRHILSLKVNYRSQDITDAVRRALKYRVFDSRAIANFLEVNAQKQSEVIFPAKTASNDE